MGAAGNIEFSFAVLGILMKAAQVFCSNTLEYSCRSAPNPARTRGLTQAKRIMFLLNFVATHPDSRWFMMPKKSGPQNGGTHL